MKSDSHDPSTAPEAVASPTIPSTPPRAGSARVAAFHLPVILLGGVGVMPILFLFAVDLGLMDSVTKNLYLYVFRDQPLRAAGLGILALVPSMYAFGTELRFSLSRYTFALVAVLFFMLMLLQSALRSGYSEPIFFGPVGGGILGVLITALLGYAGTATFDLLARRTTHAAQDHTGEPFSTRATIRLLLATIVLVGGTWLAFALRGPQTQYLGLSLGMNVRDVTLLMGVPYAVGNPTVAMLPNGNIVALSMNGVPMELVNAPAHSQPLQARRPQEQTGDDLVREAKELARVAVEEELARGRAPLSEKHKIVRQLRQQSVRSAGWRVFPDVSTNPSEKDLEQAENWFYESPTRQALIRLEFDINRRLAGIWCLELAPSGCPSLHGVPAGVEEVAVERALGVASLGRLSSKTIILEYEIMNLRYYLNDPHVDQGRVYMLGIEQPICINHRCKYW